MRWFEIVCRRSFRQIGWSFFPTKKIPWHTLVELHTFRATWLSIELGQMSWSTHWTIYSATTFLEKCRKVVLQTQIFFQVLKKWFCKLRFFFCGSRKVVDQEKRWFYTTNPHFFLVREKWLTRKKIRVCRTTFLHFSRKVVAD